MSKENVFEWCLQKGEKGISVIVENLGVVGGVEVINIEAI